MERNFPEALAHTLQFEGGWANNPNDPGGATMKGITQRTFNQYLGRQASQEELRHISDAEVAAIYRKLYWDKCLGDALADGLDLAADNDRRIECGAHQDLRDHRCCRGFAMCSSNSNTMTVSH